MCMIRCLSRLQMYPKEKGGQKLYMISETLGRFQDEDAGEPLTTDTNVCGLKLVCAVRGELVRTADPAQSAQR